jgi:ribosomal protein S18 acetylase RimI-like enzyme
MLKDFAICQGNVDNAINIMKEVAQWCEDTGKNMWKTDELSKDILLKGISEENFYVGRVGNDNAAAMILQWHDPLFWPLIEEDESGFIHKLCVRRIYSGKGLSRMMIDYAIEECKKKRIRYLRLDTGWDRQKLCDLYESLGFIKVGKKTIGVLDYALYELEIMMR